MKTKGELLRYAFGHIQMNGEIIPLQGEDESQGLKTIEMFGLELAERGYELGYIKTPNPDWVPDPNEEHGLPDHCILAFSAALAERILPSYPGSSMSPYLHRMAGDLFLQFDVVLPEYQANQYMPVGQGESCGWSLCSNFQAADEESLTTVTGDDIGGITV